MNNIIPFPTRQRQEQIESERNWAYENFTEECVDTSQFVLMMLEDYFASEDSALVIVNLISSMFMRYGGINHFLQEDLDALYNKIEANKNDIT